jgi:hypothetical protein
VKWYQAELLLEELKRLVKEEVTKQAIVVHALVTPRLLVEWHYPRY